MALPVTNLQVTCVSSPNWSHENYPLQLLSSPKGGYQLPTTLQQLYSGMQYAATNWNIHLISHLTHFIITITLLEGEKKKTFSLVLSSAT